MWWLNGTIDFIWIQPLSCILLISFHSSNWTVSFPMKQHKDCATENISLAVVIFQPISPLLPWTSSSLSSGHDLFYHRATHITENPFWYSKRPNHMVINFLSLKKSIQKFNHMHWKSWNLWYSLHSFFQMNVNSLVLQLFIQYLLNVAAYLL